MTIPPEPIAIIGAACRFPGAPDLAAFAALLRDGIDAVAEIPEDRWSKPRYFHPQPGQPGKTYSFAAGCLASVNRFDHGFFGISPREAKSVDPQQLLMLELAHEAIEDAGARLDALAGAGTGVYVGGSSWDFVGRVFADVAALDAYAMQGAALSSLANRISYVFGLTGPSLTIDTACSSSLVALHMACAALRRGEIAAAIVGGVNILLSPGAFVGFARASMLSRRGRCHAFDARADGYVRAEGGGAVLLKPLARALAAGDPIRAVIRHTGVNSDGRTNGFSLPSGPAQAALLRQVYREAEIAPEALSFFEAHGTGTPAGDPIETWAIGEALARHRTARLPIGSVKSNIGHLEPASGMAGLLKTMLAFAAGSVPPSLHFQAPNPHIDFAAWNLEVITAPRALPDDGRELIAGVNSFGFGGTNAHAILAAPPLAVPPRQAVPPAALPLLLSARTAAALRPLAEAWRDRLATAPAAAAAPLLRGAARRRDQHGHRLVAPAASPADQAARLDAWLATGSAPEIVTGEATPGGLAFVFSGNGSQWAGMGRDALAHNAAFATALAELDTLLRPQLGWSVTERLADPALAADLAHTAVAQPLLFAIQVACVAALRAQGLVPAACIGHSAGEVAAAWACGALSLAQACQVIVQRSQAQQATHGTGAMAALGLDAETAEAVLAEEGLDLAIAALNAATSVTVAGNAAEIARLGEIAAARDWAWTRLDLAYAFHSPCMDPIRQGLLAALAGLVPGAPAIPMLSTVTGRPVGAGELDAAYWWRNIRLPVQFAAAAAQLAADGIRVFLEIGPHPVLLGYLRDLQGRAGQGGQSLATLTRRGARSDPFPRIAAACHVAGADLSRAACFDGPAETAALPRYPWQRATILPDRTVERVDLAAPLRDHPLLGYRETLGPEQWMAHLSLATDPWLADHKVDGVAVLPAAAMIDIALAAARARFPEAAILELQDFDISRSLVLDAAAILDCRVRLSRAGQVELASRPRFSAEPPVPYAAGRLLGAADATPLLPTLPAAAPPDASDAACAGSGGAAAGHTDAAGVYAIAARLHLQYGAEFRTVAGVQRLDARHGIATLAPRGPDRVALGYLIDPALLDGALHSLLVLAAEQPQPAGPASLPRSMVPWRFGRVRLFQAAGGHPCRADLYLRHAGPRAVAADIALRDATGATVAELLDCWFVAMPAGQPARPERCFHTAYVPSLSQPGPAMPLPDLAAVVRGALAATDAAGDGSAALLAEACAAATAFESFAAHPAALASATPLAQAALRWLAAEGLAEPTPAGWRLAAQSDLPPAAEIWRSLFYDTPRAAAECVLLAGIGPALADPAASLDPGSALRDQLLFAGPSAKAAIAALLDALAAILAAWPAGRSLRLALTGAVAPALAGQLLRRLACAAMPVRLTLLTATADEAATLAPLLAAQPGAEACPWAMLTPAQRHGFDLVLDLFGQALPGTASCSAAALAGLLAPQGLLLSAQPEASRLAELVFRHAAAPAGLAFSDAWQAALQEAGLIAQGSIALAAGLWPVRLLLAGAATAAAPGLPEEPDLVVFAAPDDPLAEALATRQGFLRQLPIEALPAALAAPFARTLRHVVLLAPQAEDARSNHDQLAELLALLSRALTADAPAGAPAADAPPPRLWLVARGDPRSSTQPAAITGLARVAANEVPGLDCHAICLATALGEAVAADCLMAELASPDAERAALWTAGGRLVPRLRSHLPPPRPDAGPRRLDVLRPGLISSLAWLTIAPRPPGPGEVAIAVRAAALNFRDVMWAQALLPDEALMHGFSGPSLGLECAGLVTAVGPGVSGFAPGDAVIAVAPQALATQVVTPANGLMRLPEGIDFAEAATIPVAGMTVVYALGHLARLQPGERVLIHGGAGGVGLAAIQYAMARGAEVYATAGSPLRRQMLRQLGVAGAFDSRSPGFADDVLAATGGEGVDVVLNSLSGELLHQSLRLLKPFGRFLEIGKRDLYANTAIGLRPLRHNAAYFAIDSDELVALRPQLGAAVLAELAALLQAGQLRPLPLRSFGFSEAVEAFRLLQSSGHVGKIVLLPEPTPVEPPPAHFAADPLGAYVVTGGLAGFGLAAARWLAAHGATRLALISRRGAATPGAAAVLAEFAAQGVRAEAIACDIADEARLDAMLGRIRAELGPIRGVVHAAMVLDDARLATLDSARFAAVLRPKLAGALALDRLTRQDQLQLFLLFSSVTTVIGTPGQGNYVAANAALEALATRRHAEGLPALAVQFGPIADAGYLTREARVGDMLQAMLGAAPLAAAEALAALPRLLATGLPVAGIADIAWGDLRHRLPGLAAPFWDEMPQERRGEAHGTSLRAQLAGLDADAAAALVLEILRDELAGIIKQAPAALDASKPVLEFGVDSLMGVELRLALEARLGVTLPLMLLSGNASLRVMATRLAGMLQSGALDAPPDAASADAAMLDRLVRHEGADAGAMT